MAIHLFVDTNIFLSFYRFTKDDIDQLEKLEGLIGNGTLKLYVSRQLKDEFERNRDKELAASLDKFAAKGIPDIPRFMMSMAGIQDYRTALEQFNKAKNDLTQQAIKCAGDRTLAVDELVDKLMSKAGIIEVSQNIVTAARLRRDIGNPPGKSSSLGDQINWEFLIEAVENGVDLHIVAGDGDFQSSLAKGDPHRFLVDEWKSRKGGTLHLHRELKPFLNAQFEIIQLQIDNEKNAAIDLLIESGSFAMTHHAISKLWSFADNFTASDAERLVKGGLENAQIKWIATDGDVQRFYTYILDTFKGQLDFGIEADADAKFRAIEEVEDEDEEDTDDIPF